MSVSRGEAMGTVPKVVIVGGGAAGMMAALAASLQGARVTILERNPRVGKKLLATGNGRCNYTNLNAAVEHYHGLQPAFAGGSLRQLNVNQTIDFFERLGITPKVEERGKVFPRSEQASSLLDMLRYQLEKQGVETCCDAMVTGLHKQSGRFLIRTDPGQTVKADRVILTTGGKAMPSSGSDGNGFELARSMGHRITDVFPALVQLKLEGDRFKPADGVKFTGTASIICQDQVLASDSGDILFTNYGISGPPVLAISRSAGELLQQGREAVLLVSIMNEVDPAGLEKMLGRRFQLLADRPLEFALVGLINKRLIRPVLTEAGLSNLKTPAEKIRYDERARIAAILTGWRFRVRGTKSWPSAQVTAGGVRTSEIDPHTMESRLVSGLFFAGEVVDIDGDSGGFNLQWAWSSGWVAGQSAARRQ